MPYTLLVGEEGWHKTHGRDWIREATWEEIAAAEEYWGVNFHHFNTDGSGRRYCAMTVLDHAPDEVLVKASRAEIRVRQL